VKSMIFRQDVSATIWSELYSQYNWDSYQYAFGGSGRIVAIADQSTIELFRNEHVAITVPVQTGDACWKILNCEPPDVSRGSVPDDCYSDELFLTAGLSAGSLHIQLLSWDNSADAGGPFPENHRSDVTIGIAGNGHDIFLGPDAVTVGNYGCCPFATSLSVPSSSVVNDGDESVVFFWADTVLQSNPVLTYSVVNENVANFGYYLVDSAEVFTDALGHTTAFTFDD
jgi:hypothetical protein